MAMREVRLTKREATLMVHLGENFRNGFRPGDVALSLGWPVSEVEEALEVCAIYGLLDGPGAKELRASVVRASGPEVSIDDLLDPEEIEAAKRGNRQ